MRRIVVHNLGVRVAYLVQVIILIRRRSLPGLTLPIRCSLMKPYLAKGKKAITYLNGTPRKGTSSRKRISQAEIHAVVRLSATPWSLISPISDVDRAG